MVYLITRNRNSTAQQLTLHWQTFMHPQGVAHHNHSPVLPMCSDQTHGPAQIHYHYHYGSSGSGAALISPQYTVPDPTEEILTTVDGFLEYVISQHPTPGPETYICGDENPPDVVNKCRAAMGFKYTITASLRPLYLPHSLLVVPRTKYALWKLFPTLVRWENFDADTPDMMAEYVKDCLPYRNPIDVLGQHGYRPKLDQGYSPTWASATSTVADAGICATIMYAGSLDKEYSLLITMLFGMFQQMYLDYEGSGLVNYSASFPPDPDKNPVVAYSYDTFTGTGKTVCNTNVPTFLWWTWSYAMHELAATAAASTPGLLPPAVVTRYTKNIVNEPDLDLALAETDAQTVQQEMSGIAGTLASLVTIVAKLRSAIRATDPSGHYNNENFSARAKKIIQWQSTLGSKPAEKQLRRQGISEFMSEMRGIIGDRVTPAGAVQVNPVRTAVKELLAVVTQPDPDKPWDVYFGGQPGETEPGACLRVEQSRCTNP